MTSNPNNSSPNALLRQSAMGCISSDVASSSRFLDTLTWGACNFESLRSLHAEHKSVLHFACTPQRHKSGIYRHHSSTNNDNYILTNTRTFSLDLEDEQKPKVTKQKVERIPGNNDSIFIKTNTESVVVDSISAVVVVEESVTAGAAAAAAADDEDGCCS